MQIFIDRGANFDNALPTAVDDYSMVQFLLGRGAKVVSAPRKITAITNAAGAGNTEVIRLLLSHADDAELDGSRDALNWAAAGGRIDTVRLLIEHGFSVNVIVKDCIVGETSSRSLRVQENDSAKDSSCEVACEGGRRCQCSR